MNENEVFAWLMGSVVVIVGCVMLTIWMWP
jgi:hypothetical protein